MITVTQRTPSKITLVIFWLCGFLFWVSSARAADAGPARARIVRATDPRAVRLLTADANRVRPLFNAALLKHTGAPRVASAWKKIVLPSDRVGIKIYTGSGPVMATRLSLVETVIDGLEQAGVSRSRIVVFDRYAPQMEAAGYTPGKRSDGVTITATVPMAGYDPKVLVDCGIPGKLIWSDLKFNEEAPEIDEQLSTESHFSRILTQRVDKVINIPVLITDPDLGLYGCQLNASLAMVDNNRRFRRDNAIRDDAITQLFAAPIIKKKCVLHILDALIAQYAGGPEFDAAFSAPLQTLFVGNDAVAIDTLAARWINNQRPRFEIAPLKTQISYLPAASSAGLGVSDLERMDILDVRMDH